MKKLLILLIVVAAGLIGTTVWLRSRSQASASQPKIGKIDRGDIVEKMSATGKLTLKDIAYVGTDSTGAKVQEIPDTAAMGNPVKKEDVLLQLDATMAQYTLDNAKAALTLAEADLMRAQSSLKKAKAGEKSAKTKLDLAEFGVKTTTKRADAATQEMREEMDKKAADAQANFEFSQAQVQEAESAIEAAKSNIDKAKAAVRLAEVGLDMMTIKSPIDGVIILKNVVKGQPVSAQGTPILFVVAPDLNQVQIHAPVGEADINRIKTDMSATFTVDAYSDQMITFQAKVKTIAITPAIPTARPTSLSELAALPGPVMFPVTLDVIPTEDKTLPPLKPGLSANVDFIIRQVKDVLRVPNQALTFRPEGLSTEEQKKIDDNVKNGLKPLWILKADGTPQVVFVKTGATDGSRTAILEPPDDLKEGTEVITEGPPKKEGLLERPFRIGV